MSLPYKKITKLLCAIGLLLSSACSNTKNTACTRAFHNLTAHYNVIFEAQQSYQKGILAIDQNLNVDYTELLPVYKIDAPGAKDIATSYMDACVEECGKNILKHSITAKPRKNYGRAGMSSQDQAFYNKPEYCKWIDDTYLLMGKANYISGDFDNAESSLQLGVTRFKHDPSKFEAQLWLAKTFWAQKNYVESLDLINKLNSDKRHPKKLEADIHKVYADLAISDRHYDEAISHVNQALQLIKKSDKAQRAWLIFLLGDLNRMAGHYPDAKKSYEQIIKLNPDYSMVFNAKINLATVFTPGDNVDYIRTQLQALADDDKNAQYRDQIYFALAELDYRNNNKQSALVNYKKSARCSSGNNVQKAKSYLAVADIYFDKNDYINAAQFYDSTMQFLPNTYSGYSDISKKAKTLTELIKYINEAEHQDSLQRVAKLPESKRKQLIQNIIDQVIADEEAQKQAQSNPYYQSRDNNYGVEYTGTDGNPNFSGKWYLYNVTALNYGRTEFLKKWGNRPLEDNWRRKNKSASAVQQDEDEAEEDEQQDSTITNKHHEYYLRNVPLTDSAMYACISKEADSWFSVSSIYYEKIGDVDKAIESLLYINEQHPDHYLKAQAYYQLYKLYGSKGEFQLAQYTKSQLVNEFPESGYAKILNDPDYMKNVASRKQDALNLYATAISEFENKLYSQSLIHCQQGQKDFSDLEIVENFIYMEARNYGNLQNTQRMRERLEFLVENYPKSPLVQFAVNKIKALETGNFETQKFKADLSGKHYFVVSVDASNPRAGETNFRVLSFCAENGYQQADVEEVAFSDKTKLFTAFPIPDMQSAMDFTQKFLALNRPRMYPESDYKVFCISEENFQLLKDDSDIESYYNFYLLNYKP